MMHAVCLNFFIAMLGVIRMPTQTVREVTLPSNVQTHSITVRGWPGIITAIRLPDSFTVENVLCADCFDPELHESKANNSESEIGERNWILERRPKDQTLFLRPARLPSLDNPASGFATNIVVTLDGGTLINLEVGLSGSEGKKEDGSSSGFQSDAVVTLRYPERETLSGRLAEEKKRLEDRFLRRLEDAKQKWLLTFLTGKIQCHHISLGATTRSQNISLRVTDICSSSERESSSYWVKYRIENRGAEPVRLLSDSLAIDSAEPVPMLTVAPQDAVRVALSFGDSYEGIALLERAEKQGPTPRLSLSALLEKEDAMRLKVGGLRP